MKRDKCWLPMYVALWPALPARVHSGRSCFLLRSLGSFWLVSSNPGIPEGSSLRLERHDMALIRCGIESLGMSIVGILLELSLLHGFVPVCGF
jgi:hypothetical protein